MSNIVVLPPTATTLNLHMGNLYSWVLADTYARANRKKGIDIRVLESWNCLSKKLEEGDNNPTSQEDVFERSSLAIENARNFFHRYELEFEPSSASDSDKDYTDFVTQKYIELKKRGLISDDKIILPNLDTILKIASGVKWVPKGSEKRLNGINIPPMAMELFRPGIIGIPHPQERGYVFGQKFVQSNLFDYLKQKHTLKAGFYGNDSLSRWLYFVMSFTKDLPIEMIGLTGIILNKDGKKMSKYNPETPKLEDITTHPDNVRLSLLKQSFGRSFVFPSFDEEDKIRNKIINTRRFLLYFAREGNSNIDLSILQRERKDIINEVLNARFSEAYHKFRYYVTQLISRDLIESIKGKGVNKTQRLSLVDMLDSLNGIFTPVTVREYKKRDC